MKRKLVISMIGLLGILAMGCSQKEESIETNITTEVVAEVISTEDVIETEEANEDALYSMEEFAKIMGVTDETHDVEGLYAFYLETIQYETDTETYQICNSRKDEYNKELLAIDAAVEVWTEIGLMDEYFDFNELYEYYRELTEKKGISKEEAQATIKKRKWTFMFTEKKDEVGDYLYDMSQIYARKGYTTEEITERVNHTDRFSDIVATVDASRNGQKNNSSNNNLSGNNSSDSIVGYYPGYDEPLISEEEAQRLLDEHNTSHGGMSSEELDNAVFEDLTEEEKAILEGLKGY